VHFVNESGLDESGIDMGGLYKASPLLPLLVVYWHYWYKRTNNDICGLFRVLIATLIWPYLLS
jgi:hypothetical protein